MDNENKTQSNQVQELQVVQQNDQSVLEDNLSEMNAIEVKMTTNEVEMNTVEAEMSTAEVEMNTNEAEMNITEAEMNNKEAEMNTKEVELYTNEAEKNTTETEKNTNEVDLNTNETQLNTNETEKKNHDLEMENVNNEQDIECMEQEECAELNENVQQEYVPDFSLYEKLNLMCDTHKQKLVFMCQVSKDGQYLKCLKCVAKEKIKDRNLLPLQYGFEGNNILLDWHFNSMITRYKKDTQNTTDAINQIKTSFIEKSEMIKKNFLKRLDLLNQNSMTTLQLLEDSLTNYHENLEKFPYQNIQECPISDDNLDHVFIKQKLNEFLKNQQEKATNTMKNLEHYQRVNLKLWLGSKFRRTLQILETDLNRYFETMDEFNADIRKQVTFQTYNLHEDNHSKVQKYWKDLKDWQLLQSQQESNLEGILTTDKNHSDKEESEEDDSNYENSSDDNCYDEDSDSEVDDNESFDDSFSSQSCKMDNKAIQKLEHENYSDESESISESIDEELDHSNQLIEVIDN